MSDLIERQAVIQVIDAVFPVDPMKSEYAQGIACGAALAKTYVEQLPSAQPEINEWCHDCKEYDTENDCCPRWGQVIKTALEDAQPEQRWIPCSERLPELNQICIVTDETRRCAYEYGLHDDTYDDENGWTYLGHRIIAWMPLPEPYKGEQG